MTHASLFSGIGGFDLAAEWAGWTNAFNCEIDPLCRRILKYHFPDAEQYADIRTTDFAIWRGRIDVLTGGFPCQPFSLAGKRKGTEDDRYLWPEMLRAIREIRPRWVVGENVFGIVNWSRGVVFEQVCADMETCGYEVQPYILPACAVGAPHRRDRCWFVAHRADAGVEAMRARQDGVHAAGAAPDADADEQPAPEVGQVMGTGNVCVAPGQNKAGQSEGHPVPGTGNAPDTQNERLPIAGETWEGRAGFKNGRTVPNWDKFPTQPPVCGRNDGVPGGLDGITFSNWRNESIKAYGNAIVPQVALQILKTINEYESLGNKK